MKLDIKYILKPWYFAGFSAFFAFFIAILFVFNQKSLKTEIKEARSYYNKITEDIIVTERDRMIKTLSMYNLIISKYGNKYHKRYNRGKRRKYQGLEPKWQKPLFNRKCYEYEKKLGIPHFTFHTTAKIETDFNPLAATRWEDGSLKECGLFQNRKGAVGQALIFLKDLYSVNKTLAQELEFRFEKMGDLWDPLNALKIEALLFWGYRRKYGNEQCWYVTVIHWGESRIAPYYFAKRKDRILPQSFTFNKNTIREDVRDPLLYWGIWYANWANFSRFHIRVGVEQWYSDIYKKECSKLEWQFIQSWKYVKELKEGVEELKAFRLEAKKEHEKRLKQILKKAKRIDREYLKFHRQIKTGKFTDISDIFKMWRTHFKALRDDLLKEKLKLKKRLALIGFFAAIIIIILLILNSIFMTAVVVTGRIKRKKSLIKKNELHLH